MKANQEATMFMGATVFLMAKTKMLKKTVNHMQMLN